MNDPPKMVHRSTQQEWFIEGGKYFESSAISDIISALTNNDIDVPVGNRQVLCLF